MISIYCLFELTRWKAEVSKGLGSSDIKRLKDAGVSKSKKKYMSGYKKGTEEIIGKEGGKSRGSIRASILGAHASEKGQIKTPLVNAIPDKLLKKKYGIGDVHKKEAPFVKRHEAYELRARNKLIKKEGSATPTRLVKGAGMFGGGEAVGQHYSPSEVLGKEKRDTDFTTKMGYGGKRLQDLRKKTGEASLLANVPGKQLAKMEKQGRKAGKEQADTWNKERSEKGMKRFLIPKAKSAGMINFDPELLKQQKEARDKLKRA